MTIYEQYEEITRRKGIQGPIKYVSYGIEYNIQFNDNEYLYRSDEFPVGVKVQGVYQKRSGNFKLLSDREVKKLIEKIKMEYESTKIS